MAAPKTVWNKGLRTARVSCECIVCGNPFEEFQSGINEGRGQYCSRDCWKKDFKGNSGSFGNRIATGESHPRWKGDNAGYGALHMWIRKIQGSPAFCAECGKTEGNLHWSNISREYKRDVADWRSLCVSCHKRYDLNLIRGGAVA